MRRLCLAFLCSSVSFALPCGLRGHAQLSVGIIAVLAPCGFSGGDDFLTDSESERPPASKRKPKPKSEAGLLTDSDPEHEQINPGDGVRSETNAGAKRRRIGDDEQLRTALRRKCKCSKHSTKRRSCHQHFLRVDEAWQQLVQTRQQFRELHKLDQDRYVPQMPSRSAILYFHLLIGMRMGMEMGPKNALWRNYIYICIYI